MSVERVVLIKETVKWRGRDIPWQTLLLRSDAKSHSATVSGSISETCPKW